MKLYRNGKMYVEKTDLNNLESMPNFIFHEFESYFSFDHFVVFNRDEAINYFLNSFIINYDDVKYLNNDQIKGKILQIKKRIWFLNFEWVKSSFERKRKLSSNIKRRSIMKYLNYQLDTLCYYLENREYYDNMIDNYFNIKDVILLKN